MIISDDEEVYCSALLWTLPVLLPTPPPRLLDVIFALLCYAPVVQPLVLAAALASESYMSPCLLTDTAVPPSDSDPFLVTDIIA